MIKSIGLWGPPSSGKTTFLAALYIAITRSGRDLAIFGVNDESTEFMIDSTRALTNDRRFPVNTMQAGSYSWIMNMSTHVRGPGHRRFGRSNTTTAMVSTQFNIGLRDAPGGDFGSEPVPPQHRLDPGGDSLTEVDAPTASPSSDMTNYLAGCDGLILLINPVREQKLGNAHEYFMGTLLRLAQRAMPAIPPGSRLPHHVAVCITKFDHPGVYRFARSAGYRTYDADDSYLFPRVHDDDAESFFRDFCSRSPSSDADLLCGALAKFFHPERIRYFVTSAVGFYSREDRFRDDDYQNAVDQGDGTVKIRGKIYPINVLEPVLWLGQSITTLR